MSDCDVVVNLSSTNLKFTDNTTVKTYRYSDAIHNPYNTSQSQKLITTELINPDNGRIPENLKLNINSSVLLSINYIIDEDDINLFVIKILIDLIKISMPMLSSCINPSNNSTQTICNESKSRNEYGINILEFVKRYVTYTNTDDININSNISGYE
jgi:hypothetical protein